MFARICLEPQANTWLDVIQIACPIEKDSGKLLFQGPKSETKEKRQWRLIKYYTATAGCYANGPFDPPP